MAIHKPDMSCARVQQYSADGIADIYRHNERKNETYDNINVDLSMSKYNVHYKDPGDESYSQIIKNMEESGQISMRGLRKDATVLDEIVIDVNTMYFENNGGYEYAKEFYEEAFHFIEKKFGSENIVSAVMHADEINIAASEECGRNVYHYHMHAMVVPIVEKEILWSKRCKDPALRGTVKEVINQVSHSKKWASNIPMVDENGEIILRKNGKPKYRKSYSILQDELYEHMVEHGFKGFQRGEMGSTAQHLTSLQYQIEKDKERLSDIESKIDQTRMKYEPALEAKQRYEEIDSIGKKNITGKVTMSEDDYKDLTALAKEGLTSRSTINDLASNVEYYRDGFQRYYNRYEILKERYDALVEKCKPFIQAMEHFPELVTAFVNKFRDLLARKEFREQAERKKAIEEKERTRAARKKEYER